MLASHVQTDLRHVVGSLRSVGRHATHPNEIATPWPFVTISRQAGAGGCTLGTLLAERLNNMKPIGEGVKGGGWQCLDRELVERIAKDHNLSATLIDSLQHSSHTWIGDFFDGLSHSDNHPSELAIFRRVVQTIHALAQAGHVLLVGLGSVFITHNMPAGIHIRLIAPLDHRIQIMAKRHNISEPQALTMVQNLDAARNAFYHRYWPHTPLHPGLFHLTLNSGLMQEQQMVDCVLPLIKPLLHATT